MVSSVLMAASTIQINTRYLDPARGSSRLGFSEAVASAVRDDMLRRNCVRSVHLWLVPGGGPPPPEAYNLRKGQIRESGNCFFAYNMTDGRVEPSLMLSDKPYLFPDALERLVVSRRYSNHQRNKRPRNGGELPAKPTFSSHPLCAGSGHQHHCFHAFPLLRSTAHLLRLPFELQSLADIVIKTSSSSSTSPNCAGGVDLWTSIASCMGLSPHPLDACDGRADATCGVCGFMNKLGPRKVGALLF